MHSFWAGSSFSSRHRDASFFGLRLSFRVVPRIYPTGPPLGRASQGRRPLVVSRYEIYSATVHVITRRRLKEFSARHKEAEGPLGAWYAIMAKTEFASFAQLKQAFRSVDKVGKFTVFNIGGNKFRLVVAIHYNRKKVYIRHVLTHAEYDKSSWKED
jgi:mRNA interferase HigB